MQLTLSQKQWQFISSKCDESLFGGAAGGGKSYALLIHALLYALKYAGSRQLLLRRTFPELKRSLILNSLSLYPQRLASYHGSEHYWQFVNGSRLEFGYCDSESDVVKYQSAEYDCIAFDELTHFSQYQYTFLLS
ncbi:MAG: terminase family protein, partial [Clostridiales bacterium]